MEAEIAPSLVLTKGVIKKQIVENGYKAEELTSNWRRQLLGPVLCNWLENPQNLKVQFKDNRCELLME